MSTIIFVDGGCRNNGAPNAVAYGSAAVTYKGEVKARLTFTMPGLTTNNEAEYASLLKVFEYLDALASRMGGKRIPVTIKTDSQLLVGQLTGGWQCKASNLLGLRNQALAWLEKNPQAKLLKTDRSEIVEWLGH